MASSNPPSRGWQVVDALFGLLFAYSAFVNLNDPDPWLWVPLYLAGAMGCAVHAAGLVSWMGLLVFGLGNGVVAMIIAYPGIEESHPMKGFPQYGVFREEIVRESLGVGLMALWAFLSVARDQWAARTEPASASD